MEIYYPYIVAALLAIPWGCMMIEFLMPGTFKALVVLGGDYIHQHLKVRYYLYKKRVRPVLMFLFTL